MTERTLRLLYLLPAEGFGGAERQGVYHLAELPNHDVEIVALVGPGEPVVRALRDVGANHERFLHFPDRSHAPLSVAGNARYFAHWLRAIARSSSEIERRSRANQFDLIFANRTFAWLVAASVSRRLGIPYVLRAGSRPARPGLPALLSLLDRAAPPSAVFSNCRAVERTIAASFRCRSYPLPNAVDVQRYSPGSRRDARERLGLPTEGHLVGVAARPAPEKGFALLSEVVARVRRGSPLTRFVVAGEFGWRAHYEARLGAAGLAGAVRFMGHVEAMPDFFRAVDVVALTSPARSIEASPNALLEAMAVGRPIVATAVGGVPELVAHGRHGYLVGDRDARCFAERVLQLLDSPVRRDELGRAGRLHAVARHGVGTVVTELAQDLRAVALESAAFRTPHPEASHASRSPIPLRVRPTD